MTQTNDEANTGPVGSGLVISDAAPNAQFKYYVADRPGHTTRLRAAEIVLELTLIFAHPLPWVWSVFKDFDLWMNRFGYFWSSVPANNEYRYVYLHDKPWPNDLNPSSGVPPTRYIVRRVIPERIIYFDSLPEPIGDGKDGVWTGHNVMSLYEEHGRTTIAIVMEHTWYSETMSIEELRAEAKVVLDSGLVFWRDYFIADLNAAVESKKPKQT